MNVDLRGKWYFHGHPWNSPHRGKIEIDLEQEGLKLSGKLHQLVSPGNGEPVEDKGKTEAEVSGEIIDHPDYPLVIIKRINKHNDFKAVFSGAYHSEVGTIKGTFINSIPSGGTFVMERVSE